MGKLDRSVSGDFSGGLSFPSQAGITWGVEVAKGLDRLKIGFYVNFQNLKAGSDMNPLFELLDNAKQEAKILHDVFPISLDKNGEERFIFNVHSSGRHGGYAFHMSRGDVHIFVSRRKDMLTPNVLIDIGSLSCWNPGFDTVLQSVHDLLESYGGEVVKNTISEVHLCTDYIGQSIADLPLENHQLWITRANRFDVYRERTCFSGMSWVQTEGRLGLSDQPGDFFVDEIHAAHETGVRIGKGDIMMRIYDKVLELKHDASKQSVFASVWGQDAYNEKDVTRVEFQLRRRVLKQMEVHSLEDLRQKITGIWKYCTEEWARFTNHPVDRDNRHQDRAILHAFWDQVQQVKWSTSLSTVFRKKKVPTKNIEHLLDLIAGCTISLGAIKGCKEEDLNSVVAIGQAHLEDRLRSLHRQKLQSGATEFIHRMQTRSRAIWGFPLVCPV